MQINLFDKVTNILAVVVLFFFSIPNLMGKQEEGQEFEQFDNVIGIATDTLRIATGVAEIMVAVLLLMVTFRTNELMSKFVFLFLLLTMVGALLLEFFVRPTPAILPVIAAVLLIALAVFRIKKAA